MSDAQVISGIEFPAAQGPFVIYKHDDVREDGHAHESDRILVRVRRKKGIIELVAIRGLAHVRGKYTVHLPQIGASKIQTITAAARFTFELNQALKNCAEAFTSTEL